MPQTCSFRTGVRFDELYMSLPIERRNKSGSWTQRIPAMGFRLESTYCAHVLNINQEIPKGAPNPKKAFYVSAAEVQRKYPEFHERVAHGIESIIGGPSTASDTEPPTNTTNGAPAPDAEEAAVPDEELTELAMSDAEKFVGCDGHSLTLRLYGERTREKIRFDLEDIFAAFQTSLCNSVRSLTTPAHARVRNADTTVVRTVVDMRQFIELIVHFKRAGNENARLVYDWVIDVVFHAQYGDGVAPRQADHAAGVGSTLPTEFGKNVCGAYAYAFLKGSDSVLQALPSLKSKIDELGLAGKPWSLWKSGHSEHMRGRLQSADVKKMLDIHPDARITQGHFWHTVNKTLASKVETSIRNDVIAEYRVVLDEHPSMTELFVFPDGDERAEWLHQEGQAIATSTMGSAIERTELSTLKMECKHQEEMGKLREEKDGEIAKLRDDKVKLAHAAARMLCPRKKLAALDMMFT